MATTGEATGHLHNDWALNRSGAWAGVGNADPGGEKERVEPPLTTPFCLLTHHTPVVDGVHRGFERGDVNGASTHRFRSRGDMPRRCAAAPNPLGTALAVAQSLLASQRFIALIRR